jgi:hypothetical protein
MFAGGFAGTSPSDVVDVYNARTNQWSVAHLSISRGSLSATTVGDLALFAGGATTDAVGVVDVYDAATAQWFTTSLSDPRFRMAATTAGGKAIFASGFRDSVGTSADVDVFTLAPGLTATLTGKPAAGTITITVHSTGDANPPAGTTVSLYATAGTALDANALLLGQSTLPQQLARGGSVTLNIPTTLPNTLANGRYHLLAALDDGDGQGPLVVAAQAKTFIVKHHAAAAAHPAAADLAVIPPRPANRPSPFASTLFAKNMNDVFA